MSKVSDDSLRPHLTALVDGELEPLEAIALQQRLRQSPALEHECRELERLKVAVHLAGTRDAAPAALQRALEGMCARHFEARRRQKTRWLSLWMPLGLAAAAAMALVVAMTDSSSGGPGPLPPTLASARPVALPAPAPDELLPRLATFHRESGSPLGLADLKARGALLAIEHLPDTFITPEGHKPQIVQASWMGCVEREVGATLAVLRADRVELPRVISNTLDTTGVYVDIIDGVHVRLSLSGDKLFVLLSTDPPSPNQTPI